jgi:hypothetical protein
MRLLRTGEIGRLGGEGAQTSIETAAILGSIPRYMKVHTSRLGH